jgi:hypothetical protein
VCVPGLHVKDDAAGVDEGRAVVVAHGAYNVRDDEADMRVWFPVFHCSSGVRDDLLQSWRRWHMLGNRRCRWVLGVQNLWLRKTLNRRFLKVRVLEIEQ